MLATLGAALLSAGAALVGAQVTSTPGTSTGQFPSELVGTWSSKSNSTLTGPGFYNPQKEQLIEPSHTGISYSFTSDGFYEVAYYRAIANPVNPACPSGIMQWQHGQYQVLTNGSITTQPFGVDGRQLVSDPCNQKHSIFTRYNQSELFARYEELTDPYHNIPRLNLFKFDGSPLMPLYLVFRPPMMLPTSVLKPTGSATGAATAAATQSSNKFMFRRSLEEFQQAWSGKRSLPMEVRQELPMLQRANTWFWFGVLTTGVGSVLYFCF